MTKISVYVRKAVYYMKIYNSAEELIGRTPILRLSRFGAECSGELLAKLESFNPAGSVKDRVALKMIVDAEASGLIGEGSVIIEPTSGNTGIGLAMVCAVRGYRAVIVMPSTMSPERIKLMRAYGAEVVLTDGALGMAGAIKEAEEIAKRTPGAFITGQFTNPSNPAAHDESTAPEIWTDTDGEIDVFVAGAGTGGTVSGVGRYLKGKRADIKIVAVEPSSSAVLSGKPAGKHGLQGIGAGFIPEILDIEVIDEVITVTEDEAYAAARELGLKEGVLVGISSGAALHAARTIAKREDMRGKKIVVLLPDGGEKYLSTDLYQ